MSRSIEEIKAPGSIRELLPLAAPIFFSQAIDMTMIFCDRYFLAMLGKEELAATLTGGILTFLFTTLMIGTFGQIAPLVAQYKGAGQTRRSVLVVHQGLVLSFLIPPLLLAAAYFLSPMLFAFFGHEAALAQTELNYFRILSLTVITTSVRTVFANFFIGIGRSVIVTAASFSAVALNIPLAYGLIFGAWGMPKLGMEGAAVGTVIASCVPVLLLALAFLTKDLREEYGTGSRIRFDAEILGKLLRYGLPAGLEMLVNVAGFLFFTMSMFSYSADVAAATTIVLNWDMVCFVPLLGISQAVGSLVGKYLGANDPQSALRSAWSSLKLGWIHAGIIVFSYLSFTETLITLFARTDGSADYGRTAEIASTLLRISCLYFLFDATYAVLGGILKGAGDTLWTMVVSNGLMWSAATVVFFTKKEFGLTPVGAWLILTGLVFSLGCIYSFRFLRKGWLNRRMIENAQ